jgi:hypothetical protein
MPSVFKSATKLVLLMFAFSICAIIGFIAYKNSQSEVVVGSLVWVFTTSAGALFWFYFKNSTTNSSTEWGDLEKEIALSKKEWV